MKLKLDENGNAVLKDGHPVYVTDAGVEVTINGAEYFQKVNTLTDQVNTLTTDANKTKDILAKFEGLDPAQASEALAKLKDVDLGKLGNVDELRAKLATEFEEQYKPQLDELEKVRTELYGEKIGSAFSNSKFIQEKVALPPAMVRELFGKNFKYEDGKVNAYDADGNKILSKKNAGQFADVDEAFEIMLQSHPYKDTILKGSQSQGGNFNQGGKGGQGGNAESTISRADFDAMNFEAKDAFFANGGKLVD